MSVASTQRVIDRYFSTMGADEDFSTSFAEDVTWLMVENGDEVRGPGPVRDYILALHALMQSGDQRPLVVTDGHVFLEGDAVNAGVPTGQAWRTASCTTSAPTSSRMCGATAPSLGWSRGTRRPDRPGAADRE